MLLAELDLWNATTQALSPFVVSEGGPMVAPAGVTTFLQAEPRLIAEIGGGVTITRAVSVDQYGQGPRRQLPVLGNLVMARAGIESKLALRWIGRAARLFEGDNSGVTQALAATIIGLADDMGNGTITASLADTAAALADKPLVTDRYPSDGSVPESIAGKPLPATLGTVFNIEPQLIDDETQTYRVTAPPGGFGSLNDVTEVRVGGIPWDRVASGPSGGEWSLTPASAGTIVLGSPPAGLDVRCDAQCDDVTTAGAIQVIATALGLTVDSASLTALDISVPGLIGYRATEAINALDAIDAIVTAAGCLWSNGPNGLRVFPIAAPPGTSANFFDRGNIGVDRADVGLLGILPPAWRLKMFYRPNWSPCSNLAEALTDDLRALYSTGGTFAGANNTDDPAILDDDPRAVDVPDYQTFFVDPVEALLAGTRLWNAWRLERRLYRVPAHLVRGAIEVYDDIELDYGNVAGIYRAYSVAETLGGRAGALQVWG